MKRVIVSRLALVLTLVLVTGAAILLILSWHNSRATFSARDALPIIRVNAVPDGFILQSDARALIREVDEYVDFYIWKNSVGIIDSSRRMGSARAEYAFDTSIQDTDFIVRLRGGSTYVNWQTVLDFLNMLQIQLPTG